MPAPINEVRFLVYRMIPIQSNSEQVKAERSAMAHLCLCMPPSAGATSSKQGLAFAYRNPLAGL